jgi:tetratricopeptide (TPR) repeat protein
MKSALSANIHFYYSMKIQYLLLTLAASALGIVAIEPWVRTSLPTQLSQSAQVADSSSRQVNSQTAQAIANKVTVLIKVGEGFGSGVLLGKKENTYLVLTSAHVIAGQSDIAITIQTPDGQSYPVHMVKDLRVGKFDLALLEFTSTYAYQVAKIDVSKDKSALKEETKLVAAGFASDTNIFKVVAGTVKQLPSEPFINGTQIGYKTTEDIEQGMSGGPILDEAGNLVGINSLYAYPIKPVYTYADGTKAAADRVAKYQQANWGVPIGNLLATLNPNILHSYKQLPKAPKTFASSGNTAELDRKEQTATAGIEDSKGDGKKAQIRAYMNSGGKKYASKNYKGAIADYDRVIAFAERSRREIDPQSISAYHSRGDAKAALGSARSDLEYSSGIPDYKSAIADFDRAISLQERSANAIDLQLAVAYFSRGKTKSTLGNEQDAITRCKNKNGCVVHDAGISDYRSVITLYDRIVAADRQNISAYIGRGDAKEILGSHDNAIADYDRAIAIDPQNVSAYLRRGAAKSSLGEYKGFKDAIADYDRAIAIDPQNAAAYSSRGDAKAAVGNQKGAIADYDRAIAIAPQDAAAYSSRGAAKNSLWYEKEAIADYDRAIAIAPRYGAAYLRRGETKDLLGDYEGAIADYDRAAAIHHGPKSARERHKSQLKQYRSTVAEYDRKISLQERSANASNPQDAMAYFYRGNAKAGLRNYKGAIDDYNRAIALDPQNIWTYWSRGQAKHSLGDRQGGIADMNTVIQLSKGHDYSHSIEHVFIHSAKGLVQEGSD